MAAPVAPLRTVRRSTVDDSSQSVPPTSTPLASPREAQSSGPQCEGGLAADNGLAIALDMASLLSARRRAGHSGSRDGHARVVLAVERRRRYDALASDPAKGVFPMILRLALARGRATTRAAG
jgi:hypothetical protein